MPALKGSQWYNATISILVSSKQHFSHITHSEHMETGQVYLKCQTSPLVEYRQNQKPQKIYQSTTKEHTCT